ncbi:hypothetical protein Ait01nite_066480 [Actinoplanes italicus]|uniref:Uncharacterized protein n=1 Tax=Actinoplanes italicus TaxID=113567 RepID=A0A2T0KQJ7_9ACTN|nr:WD40 repeat domain-containing protein [Actinoplanes italicus]PRX26018.1 hypothetical protein CLV67_101746 [Actinoplanes italicus]GIE33603.1 hypothetical protein Ait01nite_066480 [Actinoplanes italicus]
MRKTIAAVSAAAVLGSVVLAASPASADSTRILPIKAADNLIADGTRERLFLSDRTTGVVALGYDGDVADTYALPGVSDLILTRDAARLYAAVPDQFKIVALDAETLDLVAEYPVGEKIKPYYLTTGGGKIWFSYSERPADPWGSGKENIGSLDLAGDAPVVALKQGDDKWDDPWYDKAPRLASAATDTTRIVAAGVQQDAVFEISDGTLKQVAVTGGNSSSSEKQDVALSPDGEFMATTVWGENQVRIRRTSDLDMTRVLPIEGGTTAVDIAADGTVAAGTGGTYDPDIFVFPNGSSTTVREIELGDTDDWISGGDSIAENSLAWESGGGRLFAISVNTKGVYSLRVFDEPRKSQPTLTLTGPQSSARAKALTVSGNLKSSLTLPAGTPVTVTRTDAESPAGVTLAGRTTDASGNFSFTDTPQSGGRVTYRVAYAGDETRSAVSATHAVDVARSTPSLGLNNNGRVYNYGATAYFSAYLGVTYKNRVVEVYADPWGGDQGRRLLKKATVDGKGYLYTSVKVYRNTAVQAVFTGDSRMSPRTVTATVYTKVPASLKLTKHYKTAKIGKTTYRHYKKKTYPVFTVTLPKYPNRAAYVRVDIYYQGKWRSWGDGYVGQDRYGRSVIRMDTRGWAGYKFRVRAAYRYGTSGDNVNYTTYTPYQYLYISR